MTHEGRMARGKLKQSQGFKDSETKYYLDNKEDEKMSEEETKTEESEESTEEEDVKSD